MQDDEHCVLNNVQQKTQNAAFRDSKEMENA